MEDKRVVNSPDVERKDRVPPGQRLTEQWPVLHYGRIPHIDVSTWTFTISGLVEQERRLDYQEFTSLSQEKVLSDIHCVTRWSKLDNLWEGVGAGIIGELVDLLPQAKFVVIHSAGGFATNLSLADFFQPDVLFAIRHNGQSLTLEHGHPVRLVVPRLYFWKSAKWVTGVKFVSEDKPGFWESHGYHNRGDPWKEERYS